MGLIWKIPILVMVIGLAVYDLKTHEGNFHKSATGIFIKQSGLLTAWASISLGFKTAQKSLSQTVSPNLSSQCSTYLEQYLYLFRDLFLVITNICLKLLFVTGQYIEETSPVVMEWLNSVLPPILQVLSEFYAIVAISLGVVAGYTIEAVTELYKFALKSIFVGKMSPENLQKYTLEALNTTQVLATTTFDWVYEKWSRLQA